MKFIAKPFPFRTVSGDPFPNSEYYEMGDYKIHYRVDPAKTVTHDPWVRLQHPVL